MRKTGPKTALDDLRVEAAPPLPPSHLNAASQKVWNSVTNSMPATHWKDANLPLLEDYCNHIVTRRKLQVMIEDIEAAMVPSNPKSQFKAKLAGVPTTVDFDRYKQLVELREKESRAITALARSMRLTQQAVYSARKTQDVDDGDEPWNFQ